MLPTGIPLQAGGEIPRLLEPFFGSNFFSLLFYSNEINEINHSSSQMAPRPYEYFVLITEQKKQLEKLKSIVENMKIFDCIDNTLREIEKNIIDLTQEIDALKGKLKKISWYKRFNYWLKNIFLKPKDNIPQ